MCLDINQKKHMACDLSFIVKSEDISKLQAFTYRPTWRRC